MSLVVVAPAPSLFSPLMTSVAELCGDSRQALIFGASRCSYKRVRDDLRKEMEEKKDCPIQKVFDYDLGKVELKGDDVTTLEGDQINFLSYDEGNYLQITSRPCKTAICNLVAANYFRSVFGLPLIPLIFCYDVDKNSLPFTAKDITSKKAGLNKRIAHKELRRMLALLLDEKVHSKIREIALKTFVFVKVHRNSKEEPISVERIASPLNTPEIAKLWHARKKDSKVPQKSAHESWQGQIYALLERFHDSRKEKVPEDIPPLAPPEDSACSCFSC